MQHRTHRWVLNWGALMGEGDLFAFHAHLRINQLRETVIPLWVVQTSTSHLPSISLLHRTANIGPAIVWCLSQLLYVAVSPGSVAIKEPPRAPAMSQHVRLNNARCICCQHSILSRERVAAGMLIQTPYMVEFNLYSIVLVHPTIIAMPFAFPPHGHNFEYIVVYLPKGKEDWRLCHYLPCSTCRESSKTSTFHVDCFKLAHFTLPTLPFRKLVKLTPLRTPWSFLDLVKHSKMGIVEVEILDILKRYGGYHRSSAW